MLKKTINNLLKASADVNAKDNEGMTAFDYAVKRTNTSVFKVLQEALQERKK